MASTDPDFLDRARRAREELAQRLIDQPDISLVDLGYDPEGSTEDRQIVLRVHVRRPIDREALGLPVEFDGFPVHIQAGDYHLE